MRSALGVCVSGAGSIPKTRRRRRASLCRPAVDRHREQLHEQRAAIRDALQERFARREILAAHVAQQLRRIEDHQRLGIVLDEHAKAREREHGRQAKTNRVGCGERHQRIENLIRRELVGLEGLGESLKVRNHLRDFSDRFAQRFFVRVETGAVLGELAGRGGGDRGAGLESEVLTNRRRDRRIGEMIADPVGSRFEPVDDPRKDVFLLLVVAAGGRGGSGGVGHQVVPPRVVNVGAGSLLGDSNTSWIVFSAPVGDSSSLWETIT